MLKLHQMVIREVIAFDDLFVIAFFTTYFETRHETAAELVYASRLAIIRGARACQFQRTMKIKEYSAFAVG